MSGWSTPGGFSALQLSWTLSPLLTLRDGGSVSVMSTSGGGGGGGGGGEGKGIRKGGRRREWRDKIHVGEQEGMKQEEG